MKSNLSNLMKLLAMTIVIALLAPVTTQAQAGKANFSGTWTMNAEKSTLPEGGGGRGGGRGMFGGGSFTVAQDANTLTQTREGQNGTFTTKYTLDGKETVNTFGQGESKSTAKWSADGKSLTVVTTMNFNGNDFTTTAVWTMVDARTLSITTTRQGQNGEVKTTIVYDKK